MLVTARPTNAPWVPQNSPAEGFPNAPLPVAALGGGGLYGSCATAAAAIRTVAARTLDRMVGSNRKGRSDASEPPLVGARKLPARPRAAGSHSRSNGAACSARECAVGKRALRGGAGSARGRAAR